MEDNDLYPISIQLSEYPEELALVAVKWNKEKKKLELRTENATMDEGARMFFEDFRDRFGDWIVKQIKANPDTCQYCGK